MRGRPPLAGIVEIKRQKYTQAGRVCLFAEHLSATRRSAAFEVPFDRLSAESAGDLGLSIAEGRQLLVELQRSVAQDQIVA